MATSLFVTKGFPVHLGQEMLTAQALTEIRRGPCGRLCSGIRVHKESSSKCRQMARRMAEQHSGDQSRPEISVLLSKLRGHWPPLQTYHHHLQRSVQNQNVLFIQFCYDHTTQSKSQLDPLRHSQLLEAVMKTNRMSLMWCDTSSVLLSFCNLLYHLGLDTMIYMQEEKNSIDL